MPKGINTIAIDYGWEFTSHDTATQERIFKRNGFEISYSGLFVFRIQSPKSRGRKITFVDMQKDLKASVRDIFSNPEKYTDKNYKIENDDFPC